jgi:hypothetical protein
MREVKKDLLTPLKCKFKSFDSITYTPQKRRLFPETSRLNSLYYYIIYRASGTYVTSIGNSIPNIFARSVLWSKYKTDIQDRYWKEFGFSVTGGCTSNINQVEFLKGHFIDTVDGFSWIPLPSRILKLGKTLTHPLTQVKSMLPRNTNPRLVYNTIMKGNVMVYYHLRNLPLFRAYYKRFVASQPNLKHVQHYSNPYKIKTTTRYRISNSDYYAFLFDRYGIDRTEVLQLEDMILKCQLPCLIQQPICLKLAARDYC